MNNKFEICYLINKNNEVNQREIAQTLDFALGKVNKLFKELENDEFIIKENGYRLTKKGNDFLELHRVDKRLLWQQDLDLDLFPSHMKLQRGY